MVTERNGMTVSTVGELAAHLQEIALTRGQQDDRLAYFAALYALMTMRVAGGVEHASFGDPQRMERLACHFAMRYLDALDRYDRGERAPASWEVAFRGAERWRPLILQHLLLGMNAHINFDLGIATAEVADGDDLAALRPDFDAINDVLASLLEDVQARLARVSPWMGLVDRASGRKDEAVVNFSMRRARDAAWAFAEQYAALQDASARRDAERKLDRKVALFARVILRPGRLVTLAAIPARLRERSSVAAVVDAFGVRANV